MVIGRQISSLLKARGKLVDMARDPEFAALSARHYQYLAACLDIANRCLRNEPTFGYDANAFSMIMFLYTADANINGVMGRVHMDGYSAYVWKLGGVAAALAQPSSPIFSMGLMLKLVNLVLLELKSLLTHCGLLVASSWITQSPELIDCLGGRIFSPALRCVKFLIMTSQPWIAQ